jgi:hypothetical protein
LAFQGIDIRDFYTPGGGASRMTPRRLLVLIKSLPAEAPLWAAVQAADEQSLKPTADQIRERARHYEQRAKEADSG